MWDHERNIRDDQARACAATGGVIGINGVGIFLGDNDISVQAMARHIDYAVELVGSQHVGIGTDYVFDTDDLNLELENSQIFPASYRGRQVDFFPPEQLAPLEAELADACRIEHEVSAFTRVQAEPARRAPGMEPSCRGQAARLINDLTAAIDRAIDLADGISDGTASDTWQN